MSGYLTDVRVKLNSMVEGRDTLFQLDRIPFQLALHKTLANVDNATQHMGACKTRKKRKLQTSLPKPDLA